MTTDKTADAGKDAAAQQRTAHVEALKREREGYVSRGLTDRVAQVDAELARFDSAPKGRKPRAGDKS